MNGDDIRNIFKIKTYTKKDRLILGKQYIKLCKFLTRQNVNIIFTVVGLFSELHKLNRKNFSKYIEIYIKSDLKILKKSKVRKFYCNNSKNVWGFDIKPEFPTDPHITLKNNDMSSLLKKKNDILKKIYHNLDD